MGRRAGVDELQCLCTVRRRVYTVAGFTKCLRDELANGGLVVDDQYALH